MPNVIILSAKDSLEDKIAVLNLGVDYYLPKSFLLAELHVRLKSVLRRKLCNGEKFLRKPFRLLCHPFNNMGNVVAPNV